MRQTMLEKILQPSVDLIMEVSREKTLKNIKICMPQSLFLSMILQYSTQYLL